MTRGAATHHAGTTACHAASRVALQHGVRHKGTATTVARARVERTHVGEPHSAPLARRRHGVRACRQRGDEQLLLGVRHATGDAHSARRGESPAFLERPTAEGRRGPRVAHRRVRYQPRRVSRHLLHVAVQADDLLDAGQRQRQAACFFPAGARQHTCQGRRAGRRVVAGSRAPGTHVSSAAAASVAASAPAGGAAAAASAA